MMYRFFLVIVTTFFSSLIINGQDTVKLGLPLDIPLSISGNYGEIRSVHFHTGIDFRTLMQEGLPVRTCDDGIVARIKVENGGYGKALYINHPNGITTVYAHLKCFNDSIEAYVKSMQYQLKSYSVDLYPNPGLLMVGKGDVVAFSGNMGLSTGPHLHFEVRDTKTQNILNTLKFGLPISDSLKPVIKSLWIYCLDSGYVKKGNPKTMYPLVYKNGRFIPKKNDVIPVNRKFGMGVVTYDLIADSFRVFQVYTIKAYIDSVLFYEQKFDELSFSEITNMNGYIDYEQRMLKGINVQKQFLLPNQQLSIYKSVVNKGVVTLKDTNIHNVLYEISDVYGNTSYFDCKVQFKSNEMKTKPKYDWVSYFSWRKRNTFEQPGIKVVLPENSLFDDVCFNYSKTQPVKKGFLSPIHHIHNLYTPLKKSITISIMPEKNSVKYDKMLIASVDTRGNVSSSAGGEWKDGYITTTTRSFGSYAIVADTIPPTIEPWQVSDNYDYTCNDTLGFTISDNLSGVSSFTGCIDNQWQLFEYKNCIQGIYYVFDPKQIEYGKIHELELFVTDKKNNVARFNMYFYK